MIGGIDSIVDKKVDANRANPQRLEQSYSRNKELLDLLALQKLKSEKDAAARDMQMKAEQMPGTIAEQMEKEMLDQTKNDMVEQTAGIMDQRRQKAAAQAKQMGQPPQRPAGIAGMAPQGMPQFEEGGEVDVASDEEKRDVMANIRSKLTVEKVRQLIQEGKLTKAQFSDLVGSLPDGQNKSEIVEFLETQHGFEPKDDPTKISPEEMDDIDAQIAAQSAPEEEEDPIATGRSPYPERMRPKSEGIQAMSDVPYTLTPDEMKQTGAGGGKTYIPEGMSQGEFEAQRGVEKLKNISYKRRQELRKKYPNATLSELATLAAQDKAAESAGIMAEKKRQVAARQAGSQDSPQTVTDADTGVMDGMTTGDGDIADMGGTGVLRKQEAGSQAGHKLAQSLAVLLPPPLQS